MQATVRADEFEDVVDHISNILTTSELHIYPGDADNPGLYVDQIDNANVAALQQWFRDHLFESYSCDDEYVVGVDWGKVSSAFSKIDDEYVDLEFLEETRKLNISTDSGFDYDMSLIAREAIDDGPRPDVDYDVEFTTTIGNISSAADSCSLVDERVAIEVENESEGKSVIKAWASGDNDDIGDEIDDFQEDFPEACTLFGTEILGDTISKIDNDQEVTVYMYYNGGRKEKNYPIRLETKVTDGADCVIFLAPRQFNNQ